MSRYQHGRYYSDGPARSPLRAFAARTSTRPRVTGTSTQPTTSRRPGPPRATINTPGPAPALTGTAAQPTTGQPPKSASVLPPDPAYDQTIAGLTRTRDNTLGTLGTQRHNTLLDYGYTATSDDQGNVTGLQFDPSNPYSQAALMLRNYRQRQAATTTGMAAAGQLYSGALQTAQEDVTGDYNVGSDQLQKALLGFLTRNQGQQTQTQADFETDSGTASGDRLQRAPTNPLYDPTAPTPRKNRNRHKGKKGKR